MDTTSLRTQLTEVLRSVNDHRAPFLLDPILRSRDTLQTLLADRPCRDLLAQIATFFQDAEPRYHSLRLIQQAFSDFEKEDARKKTAKSLHDVKGNFLWCQEKCAGLFQTDVHTLREENLFDLMDTESQNKLFAKFGPHLMSPDELKSVVISFIVKGVRLVSRCTPVYYNNCVSSSRFGIFVQTRKSSRREFVYRDNCLPSSAGSFIDSALMAEVQLTPGFLTLTGSDLLRTPLSDLRRTLATPSPAGLWQRTTMDTGEELRLTAFSITPLLSSEEPLLEKRQKTREIREFTP